MTWSVKRVQGLCKLNHAFFRDYSSVLTSTLFLKCELPTVPPLSFCEVNCMQFSESSHEDWHWMFSCLVWFYYGSICGNWTFQHLPSWRLPTHFRYLTLFLCNDIAVACATKHPHHATRFRVSAEKLKNYIYYCSLCAVLFIAHAGPQRHLYGGVVFVDSFPRSATGKVLKRILVEEHLMKTTAGS